MSAILLENTFQTSSPFIDTAINEFEVLRQRTPSTIACFSCSTASIIAIHSLLKGFPHCIIYQVQVWTVCWSHAGSIKVTFR